MMLILNGITGGIQCTNVTYWVNDYESAFELLAQLVATRWTLQDATIIDGNDRMIVPVEAFDGQPIRMHIKDLQREWQQLLFKQPVPISEFDRVQLKDWYLQLDAYYEYMLVHLSAMMTILESQKNKLTVQDNKLLYKRLNSQYSILFNSNQRMYKQTEADLQKNRDRLNKL